MIIMDLIKNIQCYFDLKNSRINTYFELEKSIIDKKQEAQELAKEYNLYKKECEELVKGSNLDGITNLETSSHIGERFNKYFVNYLSNLDEIKKSVDDLIHKRDILLQRYPDIKEDIEKAEKDNSQKKKFKKVMREFKNGTLKSSSGEVVTDKNQAIAIAYSESGMDKSEIEKAMVTIVKGYKDGLIKDSDFSIIQKDLEYFIPIEKAEKLEGGLADNKTPEEIAKKHKVDLEHIKDQLKMGIEVEKEHVDDKEKAKEIVLDHLVEDANYYTKLAKMEKEKSEQDELQKAEDLVVKEQQEEPKETKKYSDAIIRNDKMEILFLHRSKDSSFEPDVLGLPGGHINKEESDEDAVKRELIEETGLVATTVTKLAEASNPSISYFEVIVREPYEIVLVEEEHKNYVWIAMGSEKWKDSEMIVSLKENLEKIYNPNFNIKKL